MSSPESDMATAQADEQPGPQDLAATATDFAAKIAAASTAGFTLEPEQEKSFPNGTLASAPALVFDVVLQQKAALLGYTVQADWIIYGILVYQDGKVMRKRSLEHLQHLFKLATKPAAILSEVRHAVVTAKESNEVDHASFVAGRPAFDMETIMASCDFEHVVKNIADPAPPATADSAGAIASPQVRGTLPLACLQVQVLLF